MTLPHTPKKPARRKADWHPADIKAALEKAGWSLRRLSVHHGYYPNNLQRALYQRYPACQRFIADAIGIEPWDIWPSRYDSMTKEPITERPTFPQRRKSTWKKPGRRPQKDSTAPLADNGYVAEGA